MSKHVIILLREQNRITCLHICEGSITLARKHVWPKTYFR